MATLHFLFSDIEGSTRLWEAHPEAMKTALARHDDQMLKAVVTHDGVLFKNTGDGAAAVFDSADAALVAAAEAQRALGATVHPEVGVLKVRMAVHSGTAEERDSDYFGPPLSRVARLMAAAHGGQVLASLVAERLASSLLPKDLALRNLGEHRLRDMARREAVFQLIGEGLVADFPPLRTPDEMPNNLPVMPTSFVGRDQELVEIGKLIRGARLVTLTGVGGAGKTRLALQVAAGFVDEFVDGVWFVGLDTVTNPDLVATEVADALGIQEQPGTAIGDTILEYLARKAALLVVDNCEHLISAAAEFVDALLTAAPDCRVIATSRELLGVGGEVAYGLPSMSLPTDVSDIGPRDLGRYDAVRLFVERAVAAKPGFHITTETVPAIAEICRRLDGIPLAIELAAARLRSFTPQQIADHLDQRFQILTSGLRTAAPRQQTLAAAIDWSYRLLEEREQVLFQRLAVFQGGFDLEAAQDVCSVDRLGEFDVLELVPVLVDKSLVKANVGGDAARYRLLETIRQFASDRLSESGATDVIQRRHAEYFMSLAEEAEPNLRGGSEKVWWDRINLELDNLRLAMGWSLDAGEPELGMRLAGAMWRYWKVTFRFSEGARWLGRMFEAGIEVDKIVRAKVMLGLGTLISYMDDPGAAGVLLEGAIEVYRELDAQGVEPELLRHGYASSLISLATNIWQYDQDFDRATELWSEALEVARRMGDSAGASLVLGNLAEAAARAGDVESARAGYIESIEASYALDSTHRTVEAILLSAVFELSIDEPARAIALLNDAIDLARSGDLQFWEDFGRAMRAVAAHDFGEQEARQRFVEHVAKLFADPEFQSTFYYQLPLVLARADLEHSAGHSDRAAVLLGVLERLEEESSPMEPIFEGRRRSRLLEALAAELGEDGFAEALAQGKALSRNEATKLAAGD